MKRNLLIIEPDVFERDVFSKVLSDSYEIKFAVNVTDAIESSIALSPDAIVFDMNLPDIGALRSFGEAKDRWSYDIPLILIVSENSLEFERLAREQGIFYYMIKPFDFKELSEAIHSASSFAAKKKNCKNI